MAATVKIQCVTVIMLRIANIQITRLYVFTVQERRCPCGGIIETQILKTDMTTAQEPYHHRAVYTVLVWKTHGVSVDNAPSGKGDIFRVLCVNKTPIHVGFIDIAVVMGIIRVISYIAACQKYGGGHDAEFHPGAEIVSALLLYLFRYLLPTAHRVRRGSFICSR
jgi:hypothetical protein